MCLFSDGQQQKVRNKKKRLHAWKAGSTKRPTCYLLKVNVQLKLSCNGEAVIVASLPAVAAAHSVAQRGAAEAHVAELDVFGEKAAICEQGQKVKVNCVVDG